MTTYLPIVLGQDALQWLRHLPRHCIDDWGDFSRQFITNFQSLADKSTQPWDLKSIRRQNDETLRSFLKRFQTMRNLIPEVTEASIIQYFYRGSNDSAFLRPYSKRHQSPPNNCSVRQTTTSLRMSRPRTSLGAQNPRHPRHGGIRTSSRTSAGKKGPVRRCTPLVHLSLEPRHTSWRSADTGRYPRLLVFVPQGHVPHPAELQRLQTFCRAWPTVLATTTSHATRRAWRA
jgi:hypothetical protein